MKIDITGSDYQTLLDLLSKFPSGKITAEGGKAFWEWDGQMQQVIQSQPMAQPMVYPPQSNAPRPPQPKQNAFLNMFDSMARYF